jgi:hypothetical protein
MNLWDKEGERLSRFRNELIVGGRLSNEKMDIELSDLGIIHIN